MSIRSVIRNTFAAVTGPASVVYKSVVPTWKQGRALPAPNDIAALAEDGYRRNIIIAACIWCIATSASEPKLVVKRRKADGTLELATGADAAALRALLECPNPDDSSFTFLERLFTDQQISGNWFFRKMRATAGNVVAIVPMAPEQTKIAPNAFGFVDHYKYTGVKEPIPADDVVHDPLHPDPKDDFWGLSPIAVAARAVDLDNQAFDFLRAFFYNNATPAGILTLSTRVMPEERQRIKEVWTKEHSGPTGWHTTSVLDADAKYQEVGGNPEKLRLQHVWDETESRMCIAFGVPAILVGAVIGLNRSTFANFQEARKSFWEDTLANLYKRCGQRLTKGLAKEFADDLVIEFDLSTVQALQEAAESKWKRAMDGWNAGLLTLDQALDMMGLPKEKDPAVGEARKAAPAAPDFGGAPAGLGGLLGAGNEPPAAFSRAGHRHGRALTPAEKRAAAKFASVAREHFRAQVKALAAHLES